MFVDASLIVPSLAGIDKFAQYVDIDNAGVSSGTYGYVKSLGRRRLYQTSMRLNLHVNNPWNLVSENREYTYYLRKINVNRCDQYAQAEHNPK